MLTAEQITAAPSTTNGGNYGTLHDYHVFHTLRRIRVHD